MILYPNTEKSMPLVSIVLMLRLLICIYDYSQDNQLYDLNIQMQLFCHLIL